MTFGGFIHHKRTTLKLTQLEVSESVGISIAYLNLLENDKKTNPSKEIVYKIAESLELSKEECYVFLDLHAKANHTVSLDLPEYLMNNDIARKAVRRAKEAGNADEEWQNFIDRLNSGK